MNRGKVGISSDDHRNIQPVFKCQGENLAGDRHIRLFFFVRFHPSLQLVTPDFFPSEMPNVRCHAGCGQGSDIGPMFLNLFRVLIAEVIGERCEIVNTTQLGVPAD